MVKEPYTSPDLGKSMKENGRMGKYDGQGTYHLVLMEVSFVGEHKDGEMWTWNKEHFKQSPDGMKYVGENHWKVGEWRMDQGTTHLP